MTEAIAVALIGAVAMILIALWQGWIGGDTRVARAGDRKRENARALIKVTVRQGVDQFLVDLRRDPVLGQIDISVDKLIESIIPVLELCLDGSVEVIQAKLKALRDALLLVDMNALRLVMPVSERFGSWCETQIPPLIAVRRDLGFSRADCDRVQDAWDEHFAIARAWLERVKADSLIAVSPPSTPR